MRSINRRRMQWRKALSNAHVHVPGRQVCDFEETELKTDVRVLVIVTISGHGAR